jgi:hypothetical protein
MNKQTSRMAAGNPGSTGPKMGKAGFCTDLTERSLRGIPVQNGEIQFDCNSFEFVTVRLDARA